MKPEPWDAFADLEEIKKDFIFGTPTKVVAIEVSSGFKCYTVLFTNHDGDPCMEIRVYHMRSGNTYTSKHSTSFHNPELLDTVPHLFYHAMRKAILGTEKYIGQKTNNALRELLSLGGIHSDITNYVAR